LCPRSLVPYITKSKNLVKITIFLLWNSQILHKAQPCSKCIITLILMFVCLFICFESHEQFFSYLATVTNTGDGAANLDRCLAFTAFRSEAYFTCNTYCDTGPPFLRSYLKDPWFYILNAVLLAKKQSQPILNVLGLTRPAWAGLELTTYRWLSESTTTRLGASGLVISQRFNNDNILVEQGCASIKNKHSVDFHSRNMVILSIFLDFVMFETGDLWHIDEKFNSFLPSP
jgi:hypothetical protein